VRRGFASIDRRSLEWGALAASAVLGALAVWLLVRLISLLVPRDEAALDSASVQVGSADTAARPATSIAKWHLFGNTPVAATGAGAAALQSLILRGTLADRDPTAGVAVIDGGGGEQAYRAGEAVASGMKLLRVYPDHAVLSRDGVEETLTLTRDRNLQPAEIVRQPGPGGARTARANMPGAARNAPGAATAGSAGQTMRASPELQHTIDRLRQNPAELAERVQIVPVLDGGRLTGVRVSTGTDAALMNQIGLRPGDVVTAVNGAPINSVASGQQIIDGLRNAASARVTVLRDGKPTDITISLK
jgi:general secretion pathway protein C